MPLRSTGKKLHIIVMLLVVDFAKDEFQQFPKRLRFLETLIACDIVVAAPEGEQERVRCSQFQLIEARSLGFFYLHAEFGNVGSFLELDFAVFNEPPISKPFNPIRPHAVFNIRASGHVTSQLANAILFVC